MDTRIFEQRESSIRGYCRAYPTVFAKAQNARLIDEAGKSYIDFFAGAGVLNFGHNNAAMKEALVEFIQSDGVAHSLDMYTTVKREFVQAFVQTILEPRGMPHKLQFMGPTGSNAVEAALKLARRVTQRPQVIAFSHGFHGMTLGALACTANDYFRNAAGVPLEHVRHYPFEGSAAACSAGDHACLADLSILRDQFNDTSSGVKPPAAFVVEAVQAEGGVNVASEKWLHALQQLARDFDSLLIVDDIQAGCGRTGSYFSFDGIGLDPDIVCLAKGIGGFGTPLAMNLVKPQYDEAWSPGEHTGTFRGQGLSFVAGREALRYFETDDLMQEVRRKGQIMSERLQSISGKHQLRGFAVRGKGMMQGLDTNDGGLSKQIAAACFQGGLLIGPCGAGGRVLKLIPPLTISDGDLDEGLSILDHAVSSTLETA